MRRAPLTEDTGAALAVWLSAAGAVLLVLKALVFGAFVGCGVEEDEPTNWLGVVMVWPSLAAAAIAVVAAYKLRARALQSGATWALSAVVIALSPSIVMVAIGVAQGELLDIVGDADGLVYLFVTNVAVVPLAVAALLAHWRSRRQGGEKSIAQA